MNHADLQPIIEAVELASKLCRHVQATYIEKGEKAGREPVTIADYGSQALICRAIQTAFPNDSILSEEAGQQFAELISPESQQKVLQMLGDITGDTYAVPDVVQLLDYGKDHQSERVWVIDPIDGTKGFLNFRRYTIAVGCLESHQPVGGIMGCPGYPQADSDVHGMVFYAMNGEAYGQKLFDNESFPVSVSNRQISDAIRITQSVEKEHVNHELMDAVYAKAGITNPVRQGVDGQDKYAMIAAGDAELYLRIPPNPDYRQKAWDHAAGVALVLAAGGKVTDERGKPIDFSTGKRLENNETIVVTNGHIHDHVLQALSAVLQN